MFHQPGFPMTAQGDPVVVEFYVDLGSYPIILNSYCDYRIAETVVTKQYTQASPTGAIVAIKHRVELL